MYVSSIYRMILASLALHMGVALTATSVLSQENRLSYPKYLHDKFHEAYKKIYDKGKCHCRWGYCRPTRVRLTQLGAVSGWDIEVSGVWMPVPGESLQNETSLSPEIMSKLMDGVGAHVCAYPDTSAPHGQRIECSIFPSGT